VVKVRVSQEHVPYRVEVGELEVANASAGVNQNVVVHEHGRRPRARSNAAAASKYSYTHILGVLKTVTVWDDSYRNAKAYRGGFLCLKSQFFFCTCWQP
jgi:hypothetical protein